MNAYDKNCEFCNLIFNRNFTTTKYYEDANFVMIDCQHSYTPMLISKNHGANIDEVDNDMVYALFWKVLREKKTNFSMSQWYVDKEMKENKGHWHCYLRKR